MKKKLIALLFGASSLALGGDAVTDNIPKIEAKDIPVAEEVVKIKEVNNVVEAEFSWKDATPIKVSYDLGEPTLAEKVKDERDATVITELVNTKSKEIEAEMMALEAEGAAMLLGVQNGEVGVFELADGEQRHFYTLEEKAQIEAEYAESGETQKMTLLPLKEAQAVYTNIIESQLYEAQNRYRETDGYKVDILLNEKPTTNVFCYAVQGAENYDFFFQPPLTEQEIAEGASRPPEIEGSYAVYHKTLKNHVLGKENYATGKVMHIPRPQVWSMSDVDTKVWADMNYNDGQLCVTVPQGFLNSAKYPVRVDPTFGYTSVGASMTITIYSGRIKATGDATTGVDGTGISMSFYGKSNDTLTNQVQMAVYTATSYTQADKITNAQTNSVTINTIIPQWWSAAFASAPTFSSGSDYFLFFNATGTAWLSIASDTGATNNDVGSSTVTFGTWSSTFALSSNFSGKAIYSIYATYACPGCTTEIPYTTGTTNWTPPDTVTSAELACWGGGGGGDVISASAGGGGGGGAFASTTATVWPRIVYPVRVGAGGAAGTSPTAGGNSYVGASTVASALVLASGGSAANNTTGGSGGATTTSLGTTLYKGGNGGNGNTSIDTGGGGGGAAGPNGAGGNGAAGNGTVGGGGGGGNGGGNASGATGGSAGIGGGAGGTGDSNGSTAPDGGTGSSSPLGGGGGGGGDDGDGGGNAGSVGGGGGGGEIDATFGDGGAGQCIITYTIPATPGFSVGIPATSTNDTASGTLAWTTAGRATTSNNSYAYISASVPGGESNILKAYDFGFAIPTGATINGISVGVEAGGTGLDPSAGFKLVKLVNPSGAYDGENKAAYQTPQTNDKVFGFGGSTDDWGITWTAEDINDPDFGVGISIDGMSIGGSIELYIDAVVILVYYTEAGGGGGGGEGTVVQDIFWFD